MLTCFLTLSSWRRGTEITACQAGDAKRTGTLERLWGDRLVFEGRLRALVEAEYALTGERLAAYVGRS